MAFYSRNSKDYVSAINNLTKPTYTSQYNSLINDKLKEIINNKGFSYDVESDPNYQNYKQNYIQLGKDVVKTSVNASDDLSGGYANSYGDKAASEANQQYITKMTERIPQLMNAAMQKYQMEQENAYKQFSALQNEESRNYGQYRDKVSDYYKDLEGLNTSYSQALAQENNEREFNYKKSRDAVSDEQWSKNFNYQKERDTVSDNHWNAEFDYKKERDAKLKERLKKELEDKYSQAAISDDQWQKEFDLKKLQYEQALEKAKSGGSGRSSSSSNNSSENTFFKIPGTANTKSSDINTVDTSRNATLSVNKRNELMNTLLSSASSISEARKILNQWGYNGEISEGDWDYLEDLYKKAKKQGITQFKTTNNTKKRG